MIKRRIKKCPACSVDLVYIKGSGLAACPNRKTKGCAQAEDFFLSDALTFWFTWKVGQEEEAGWNRWILQKVWHDSKSWESLQEEFANAPMPKLLVTWDIRGGPQLMHLHLSQELQLGGISLLAASQLLNNESKWHDACRQLTSIGTDISYFVKEWINGISKPTYS